jgi:molybdopterin molybdotransferase
MQSGAHADLNARRKPVSGVECRAIEATGLIDAHVASLPAESVPVPSAAGRRLAAPVVAVASVPGFRRAAMDGFAFRFGDLGPLPHASGAQLNIVGESLPGKPFIGGVGTCECVLVATGAVVPDATDTVVRWERVNRQGQTIVLRGPVEARRDVSRTDEDIPAGSVVVSPPRTLRPQDIAACCSAGIRDVQVIRRPRVGILSTGDELFPAGAVPPWGSIVDSNSVILENLVERDHGRVEGPLPDSSHIIRDDPKAIRTAMAALAERVDCLLVSGSTSHGRGDCAVAALQELGELFFRGVRIRPAAPTAFGVIKGTPVFLLPGNPVACLFGYELFARRALQIQQGVTLDSPYERRLFRLSRGISSACGRIDFIRVRLSGNGTVEAVWPRGASVLSSAVVADGFVVVPEESSGYDAGETVEVHLFDRPAQPVIV